MSAPKRPLRLQPVPQVLYTGPAVPVAYDPKWQLFINLTKDQIAAFKAFPEWQQKLAALAAK